MIDTVVEHLITGDELNQAAIHHLLSLASEMKKNRSVNSNFLNNQTIALVFEKPSLRTRFSFTKAVRELGGDVIESISQTRKTEAPKDFIRVIQNYCSAMMIRTFDDNDLEEMARYADIPMINGLTDKYHPCQALADLLTLKETFNTLDGLKIAYMGDGNNVLHSLMMLANKVGVTVHYCCPKGHEPDSEILASIENQHLIKAFLNPQAAVENCHAIYTDVWTSMGFDENDESDFEGYQVNEHLMSYALDNAVFMHCMPMERGKEVSDTLPDVPCSVIFQQSENRLHVQKAVLFNLLQKTNS